MKVFLLAAGEGNRLRPITNLLPKCLVPICGQPLLEIWLKQLIAAGFNEIIINTHYKSEMIEKFVDDSQYKKYVSLVNEKVLLGTGGSVVAHRKFFEDDDVIVIHADNLSIINFKELLNAFYNRSADLWGTVMTFATDEPQNCGIVTVDESGRLTGYIEKPKFPVSNLANAAIYCLSTQAMQQIYKMKPIDLAADFIASNFERFNTYHNVIYHRDIGTPVSFGLAQVQYSQIIRT